MQEINLLHAMTKLSLRSTPQLINKQITHTICSIYEEHNITANECRQNQPLKDVFLMNTQLNESED